MTTTALRAQWRNTISTYGRTADSATSARLAGAAKVANATQAPATAGWYAKALTVFWS